MINIYDKIKEIVLSVRSSGDVDSFADNLDGTYTITTADTGNLQAGFKVLLQYSDSTLNRDVTLSTTTTTSFIFEGDGVTQPDTWQMCLYFEPGHRIELQKKYTNKAKSINKFISEYPLIWMYTDITKNKTSYETCEFETTVQFAVVNTSELNLYEDERIEQKFTPVLYPYLELINVAFNTWPYKANFATDYGTDKDIDFMIIDRPFFGSADKNKNVLPQITDAIEWEVELKWKKEKMLCQ